MKPKTKNIIHLIISIIILIVSIVFSLCKWKLFDINPIADFLVFIINIQLWIFTIFFMIFAAIKLRGRKRLTVIFIYFFCIVLHIIFYSDYFHMHINYIRNRQIRQQVVERIEAGDFELDKNYNIILTDDEQRCISKNGFVGLVNTNAGYGVYFCMWPGLIDSSSGFVYFIDSTDNIDENIHIVHENMKLRFKFDDDIYYIGTY